MTLSSVLSFSAWRDRIAARRDQVGPLPVRDRIDLHADRPARVVAFDQPLVAVVIALLAFGLVMVYSASVAMPDNPKFANYTGGYFLQRHLMSLAIALVTALAVVQVPIAIWEKFAPLVFVVSLALLVIVLLPFVGKVVNLSRRWIPLGIMNFQTSTRWKIASANGWGLRLWER